MKIADFGLARIYRDAMALTSVVSWQLTPSFQTTGCCNDVDCFCLEMLQQMLSYSYKQILKKHVRDIAEFSFSKEETLITAKKDDFIYF